MTAIKENDRESIRHQLLNFGREKISKGLSIGEYVSSLEDKYRFVNNMNKMFWLWKTLTKSNREILYHPTHIGRLYGCFLNDKLICYSSFRHSYYAHKIAKQTSAISHPVVLEIGGGFGGLAYHLFHYANFQGTYICFDIPEVSLISQFYLKSIFPNKKFLLFGEKDISKIQISDYDFILLPPFEIHKIPPLSVYLTYNSHSLTEMDSSSVLDYLKVIEKFTKTYFLHANHEIKHGYIDPMSSKVKRHIDLSNPAYQLPESSFKEVYRIPEPMMDPIAYGRYFEYLYKRIS